MKQKPGLGYHDLRVGSTAAGLTSISNVVVPEQVNKSAINYAEEDPIGIDSSIFSPGEIDPYSASNSLNTPIFFNEN